MLPNKLKGFSKKFNKNSLKNKVKKLISKSVSKVIEIDINPKVVKKLKVNKKK